MLQINFIILLLKRLVKPLKVVVRRLTVSETFLLESRIKEEGLNQFLLFHTRVFPKNFYLQKYIFSTVDYICS